MKTLLQRMIFFSCGTFCTSVLAAESTAKSVPLATDFAQISSLVVSLVFILGLILICAWLVKRVSGITHAGSQQLKVLGALSVGSKERALLVSAGETQLLLGVASGSVSLLHVFDEPVVNADELSVENNFANTLKQMTGRGTAEVSAHGTQ
ncbi:MAG: flagellar biosynthetic protein FliO [Pseudomonadales bacterium]